jgi:hypothetical protein
LCGAIVSTPIPSGWPAIVPNVILTALVAVVSGITVYKLGEAEMMYDNGIVKYQD